MDRPIIPIKTPAGQAEMNNRQRRISQRHRTMLLLIDGRRTESQVRALSAQAGVPGICFEELLGLGLVVLAQTHARPRTGVHGQEGHSAFGDDSELPASRTLPPESIFSETTIGPPPPPVASAQPAIEDSASGDPVLERAREMLLRAVRLESPVAGSLTMFRLRRARSRNELEQLIEEVASRIGKPPHALAAQQTLRRVRNVLDGRDTSPGPL